MKCVIIVLSLVAFVSCENLKEWFETVGDFNRDCLQHKHKSQSNSDDALVKVVDCDEVGARYDYNIQVNFSNI